MSAHLNEAAAKQDSRGVGRKMEILPEIEQKFPLCLLDLILICIEIMDELRVLRDKKLVQDLVASLNNSQCHRTVRVYSSQCEIPSFDSFLPPSLPYLSLSLSLLPTLSSPEFFTSPGHGLPATGHLF